MLTAGVRPAAAVRSAWARKPGQSTPPFSSKGSRIADMPTGLRRGRSRRSGSTVSGMVHLGRTGPVDEAALLRRPHEHEASPLRLRGVPVATPVLHHLRRHFEALAVVASEQLVAIGAGGGFRLRFERDLAAGA